jgi:hypothetical protein
MYQALVLVRNVNSPSERLDFKDFVLRRIGYPQLLDVQKTFSSPDIFQDDWLLEKTYAELPNGPAYAPAGVGGIPEDIEDTLFLLRLHKVGDVSFVLQAVVKPDGTKTIQHPYRFINDLNSHSVLTTELYQEECDGWRTFAEGLRKSGSWRAPWFLVARRFFLYGGAKEFSPRWDEVDRIVDYTTALEATLVPEMDFSRRRISRRAALLISDDPGEQALITDLVKNIYDIRSTVVHGSVLSDEKRNWLIDNCAQVELRVRQVLVAAVQKLPPGEEDRRAALAAIYDPSDDDRGDSALQRFRDIKTAEVRKRTAAEIARLTS